jgi:hypothetical protein
VKSGRYDPSTRATVNWTDIAGVGAGKENKVTNYYDVLGIDESKMGELQSNHNQVTEYMNMGAIIGGGFTNTLKLKVMEYHEAINGPHGEVWKAEVKKEHQRMVSNGVFEPIKISDLPKGTKLINTTWAMKKKSSGTLRGRVNVQGFHQVEGKRYNEISISALVTDAMTSKMTLTLMLIQGGIAHVVDVKGAFLYGEFEDEENVHIKVSLGFKEFYNSDTALLLKKTLYGLK